MFHDPVSSWMAVSEYRSLQTAMLFGYKPETEEQYLKRVAPERKELQDWLNSLPPEPEPVLGY